MRTAEARHTKRQPKVQVAVNLDGGQITMEDKIFKWSQLPGQRFEQMSTDDQVLVIDTGYEFLTHMFHTLALHSGWSLILECARDDSADDHHSAHQCGTALGEAFKRALGPIKGVKRFGSAYAPLDDALAQAVVDLSNRPYAVVNLGLDREKIGKSSCEMVTHLLESFAQVAGITMHVECLRGVNDHHRAIAAFKALGLAIKEATSLTGSDEVPSTKGVLG